MTSEAALYSELAALRKGLGVRDPYVRDRIGPELRELCGVDDTTSHLTARNQLTELLLGALEVLPDDHAVAARVMLAMEADYPDQTLTLRQQRLANVWTVDPMAVRARCNLALQIISSLLAERGSEIMAERAVLHELFYSSDWYTMVVSTTLRLGTPQPEANEVREIVSLQDGLSRVALGLGLPRTRSESRPRMGLEVEMRFGGELESGRQPSAEYFIHYIRFPRPLARGERHTFGRTVRVPRGQLMAPHYVTRPLRRVDRFELRVKFDPVRPPKLVWRLAGIPRHLRAGGRPAREDTLELDSRGEVSVVFDRLKPSHGYGVHWRP